MPIFLSYGGGGVLKKETCVIEGDEEIRPKSRESEREVTSSVTESFCEKDVFHEEGEKLSKKGPKGEE